jgi:hypothetical protein
LQVSHAFTALVLPAQGLTQSGKCLSVLRLNTLNLSKPVLCSGSITFGNRLPGKL